MSERFDIKRAMCNAIEIYEHPLAGIILDQAYGKVNQLGKMLSAKVDKAMVHEYTKRLMEGFSDEELNRIAGKPEFVVAVASMLSESLIKHGHHIHDAMPMRS